MQRVGFVLKVKAELIDEYKRRHENVWPEMLEALHRTGWHNYSLFMGDDGLLFGYLETPDTFKAALEGMSREEINERWQAEMAPFFEGTGDHADEMMKGLVEVFHLNLKRQAKKLGLAESYDVGGRRHHYSAMMDWADIAAIRVSSRGPPFRQPFLQPFRAVHSASRPGRRSHHTRPDV